VAQRGRRYLVARTHTLLTEVHAVIDKLKLDEIQDEMRAQIANRVAEGFDDEDNIVASVTEMLEGDHNIDGLEPFVERLTAELMQEHLRLQSEWVGPTDCDRLDQAFDALESQGIVSRQNFTCCSTCGHSEIWGEIEQAEGQSDGYTFYHMQDTESAVEGGFLYLAFGATSGGEEGTRLIGERVASALRQAGLTVEWDGSPSRRIGVQLEWRRRR
jgi:hypothetical protein